MYDTKQVLIRKTYYLIEQIKQLYTIIISNDYFGDPIQIIIKK